LLASCYFYMYFKPVYILIIFFTILVDYVAGIGIEMASGYYKKVFLVLSLVTNIGVLAFYKYFNFLSQNINVLSHKFGGPQLPLLDFILPIGLSFHTFQAMSYTIEVYRGNQRAERHLGIYALYVMFYPQMVAGPIERPQQLLPQFYKKIQFNKRTFIAGLFLMIVGLFKKVVIADRLGLYVDPVFSDPHRHTSLELLTATYFFAFQIYCDFSGYTDIAIGAALTLGIELMKNFNMPYLSGNIAVFWKRWHISLSSWFRDYLYIPLGGNRVTFLRNCANVLIVFLISGLWHGANWKYLVWGCIHGCLLIGYLLWKKLKISRNVFPFIGWLVTFNCVCLAWVFFRADTVGEAVYIITKIFTGNGFSFADRHIMPHTEIGYCAFLIILLLSAEVKMQRIAVISNKQMISWGIFLVLACYFLGIFNETQFIYFQF